MINISWLMQFLEIVDQKSINQAAKTLYISQSVLSRNMKKLEESMGYPLMNRSNQGVSLTKEGRLLYQCSQSLANDIKFIEALRKEEDTAGCSELHIYLFSLFMRTELLLDYISGDDSASMVLKIYEAKLKELLQGVQEDELAAGVAVLSDAEVFYLKKRLPHMNLSMEVLSRGGVYLQVRESCKDVEKDGVLQGEVLEHMRFVHLDLDAYSILRLNLRLDSVSLTNLKRKIMVNSYPMLVEVLANTNSFSLGNQWQIEEMKRYGIRCIEIPDMEMGMNLVLFQNKKGVSPEVETFVTALKRVYEI